MAGNDDQSYRNRFTKSGINTIRACHQKLTYKNCSLITNVDDTPL